MSARTLAPWQLWLDEEALQPSEKIVVTSPNQVINDLEYCLDAGQLVLSDVFARVEVAGDITTTIRTYSMYTKDYADVASPASFAEHEVWVRAWCPPFEEGEVFLAGGGGGGFTPISVTDNIPAWYKYGSTYEISTHGAQVDIQLQAAATDPGWSIFVDGLMIVAIDES